MLHQLFVYLWLVGAGVFVGIGPWEAVQMNHALTTLAPIALTALVASLLLPFAAFAESERWQRLAVTYGMVPIFGIYATSFVREHSMIGVILLALISAVHFGYWNCAVQSRAYRLRQFELGFSRDMPKTTALIAVLNLRGHQDLANQVIMTVVQCKPVLPLGKEIAATLGTEYIYIIEQALTEHNPVEKSLKIN